MYPITFDATAARPVAPSHEAVRQSSDYLWTLAGMATGALSGAMTGVVGSVIWFMVFPSATGTFIGIPLFLATVVAATLGALGVLIVGGSSCRDEDAPSRWT